MECLLRIPNSVVTVVRKAVSVSVNLVRMKDIVVNILLFIAGALAQRSQHISDTPPDKAGFTNTFYDSFSGTAGALPSSSNWLFDTGTSYPGLSPGWGNGESETYTTDSSNMAITADQTLLITPQVSSTGSWTSGRIETARSDFVCLSGKKLLVEAKMKIGGAASSQMQGIWPAFWALGEGFRGNYNNWPTVGEWDIYETVNGLQKMYTTVHCGVAPGGPCKEYNGIGSNVDFSFGVWHTVGFQVDLTSGTWSTETLTWYLDGAPVFTVSGSTVNDEQAWEELAYGNHFLLLNVAVGGTFPNALASGGSTPNSATIGGSSVGVEVDYVGVWNSV